ncbi:restriction endonuclease subunit S [Arthrobacter psychrochitiniphilus]|uniref:Type I restriction modification DNA specificity domain-containing protein n=1 Tax=Arthrobacter psychrochitiniphilus TaxID=291045 RepID=A0A2V3DR05_9MICC|nr:restriction endonuclease subunit S [Arthrobacter psychrochitiniphilus]NYG17830.1 type I restriction enzyme S subunit [Arthrobacter psychrochitiniphilus]PXA65131.1 hypothetical protein CVS29_10590 [Arthrobacter psychrochitiniphilus]
MTNVKPYPEYVDSGVEWFPALPSNWSTTKLKHIATCLPGGTPDTLDDDYWLTDGSGTPWVAIGDMSGRQIIHSTSKSLTDAALVNKSLPIGGPGTLLFAMYASVGEVTPLGISAAWNQALLGIVAGPKAETRFIYYVLQSVKDWLPALYRSNTQNNLNAAQVGNFDLPLPPLAVQQSVSTYLDRETAQIDDLIGKQERLIELLAEKRQAVTTQAVTKGLDPNAPTKPSGVPWLGSVPTHWTVMTINRLASVISKGTTPTTIGAEFTDQGVKFLKAENIQNNQVWDTPANFISTDTNRLLARSQLQVNDLLVVIAGATTGKSAVLLRAQTPSNTNQAVAFVRPRDPIMSKWIHHVLSTQRVQSLISSLSVQSAQPNLSMGDLGKIWVTVPPPVEIDLILSQTSRAIENLDSLTMMARRAVELLRERRSALISAAVTGKIDVREGVA